MEEVSQAWKQNQNKHFVSESFVEINLNIGDPEAQADATTSDNGHVKFSNVGQIAQEVEKNPANYATLEPNIWKLNGKMKIPPASGPYGNNGYIGDVLSGEDGNYTAIPTITISFSGVFDNLVPGMTIIWSEVYDEWADTFRVTAYNGTTISSQKTVEENRDIKSVINMDISNYDKITIEILKWSLPGRRARIKSLTLGVEKVFARSDIMKFSHNMMVNPLSAELPKSEIVFEIKNLNGEYNPDNPQGFVKYLLERQMITGRYGYKLGDSIEWIKAGTFYMSEWETPQNGITATFTARDALEYMSDLYTGTSSGTLMAIATAAIQQAGLPKLSDGSNRWILSNTLNSVSAPAGIDLNKISIGEVLQYVANAACCVFYQDRNGIIHIEPLGEESETDYEINQFNSYSNAEMTLTKQLKAIDVNNKQYVLTVGTVGETQPINNPLISDTQAPIVAQWAASYLQHRKTLSGSFRADPRLDPLDRVTNQNQFSESIVLVTEINYTYNGAFRGSYEGRQGV